MNEGETDFTMWASLGEYVAQLADSLEKGTDFLRSFQDGSFQRYRPSVGGGLDWDAIPDE